MRGELIDQLDQILLMHDLLFDYQCNPKAYERIEREYVD